MFKFRKLGIGKQFPLFDSALKRFLLLMFLGCAVDLLYLIYLPNTFFCKEVFADVKPLIQKSNLEFLIIRGFFDEEGNISVYPIYTVREKLLEPPDRYGKYALELQDAAGSSLGSCLFGMQNMHVIQRNGSDKEIKSGYFAFTIPCDSSIQKLVIRKGTRILWHVERSPNAPVVSINKPTEGESISGSVSIEWTGFDADGDTLYYCIEYSEDGGLTWQPVSGLHRQTSVVIDTIALSSKLNRKDRILCVVCTDGFNTTRAEVQVILGDL